MPSERREESRERAAAYLRCAGVHRAEAARVVDDLMRELDSDGGRGLDLVARIEAARRRLRDIDLFRQGLTQEQVDLIRLHYAA